MQQKERTAMQGSSSFSGERKGKVCLPHLGVVARLAQSAEARIEHKSQDRAQKKERERKGKEERCERKIVSLKLLVLLADIHLHIGYIGKKKKVKKK